MTFRGFRTRADLKLRAPRSRSTNITRTPGLGKHYGGATLGIPTALSGHARCETTWRNWQTFHMDGHRWVDLAYSFGFCQHGYVFAGRGLGVRTAANGTNTGNAGYLAACWIGGGSDRPTRDALDALDEITRIVVAAGGRLDVRPHSAFKATACPGDHLRTYVPSITRRPAPAPTTPTAQEDDDMPAYTKWTPEDRQAFLDDVRSVGVQSLHSGLGQAAARDTPTGRQIGDYLVRAVSAPTATLLQAQVANLTGAVAALARGEQFDQAKLLDGIREATARGILDAGQALRELDA